MKEFSLEISGSLTIMDLHDNKLSGEVDASFWNVSSLYDLSVASNSLTGQIGPAICRLTSIRLLDLSNNNFAGSIPNCSSALKLSLLNISGNSLSGSPEFFLRAPMLQLWT